MSLVKLYVDDDGNRFWSKSKDGKPYREDGPAIEYRDGAKAWYRDGKLHRDGNRPAFEGSRGLWSRWEDGTCIRREYVGP